jgi:gamma-glutamyltranspeptidase / glutathione hydrolase / leukotriene-C4 hydrolase
MSVLSSCSPPATNRRLPDNFPAPHKRPLSSITPVVTEHPNGTLSTVLGGSGGSQIFPSVFQVMLNLDWGMGVNEAVEFGRVHDQLYPWRVEVDDVLGKETAEALRERGHNVSGEWEYIPRSPTLIAT